MSDIPKSPLVNALDGWLNSDEGKKCKDGYATAEFLSNRLMCAFIAGWSAAANEVKKFSENL